MGRCNESDRNVFNYSGHFFPCGIDYIYSFSVPLFFVISGFLTKVKPIEPLDFIKKMFRSLGRPMLIYAALNVMLVLIVTWRRNEFTIFTPMESLYNVVIGNSEKGLGVMWFVYTLIVLKLIYQFISCKIIWRLLLPISIIITVWLNYHHIFLANAIINTCMALPFFMLGHAAQCTQHSLHKINCKSWKSVAVIGLCLLGIALATNVNPAVRVFRNEYGNVFTLFLFSGVCGTVLVFILSKIMSDLQVNIVATLSRGNIFTLGVHLYIILIVKHFCPNNDILYYLFALIILLMMYPLIKWAETRAPYLLGK